MSCPFLSAIADLEERLPAELGELGLMRVEHELAQVREAHLGDATLALAEHHRVRELGGLRSGPGRVPVEEVAVQVERVDEVVLEDVHQVDPDELVPRDLDRTVHVREADGVDRVDLVGPVEVGVEAVEDHDHLVRVLTALLRVDDERAVEALRDVLGQRSDVAVVEVQAGGSGVELVGGAATRLDLPVARARDAVLRCGVDPVEVHRVRVGRPVDERDPQQVALAGAERRSGDAAVVGPGGELHAGSDLDLLVGRDDLPLADRPSARVASRRAPVEVAQDLVRVEAVGLVVHLARGTTRARHRGPPPRSSPCRTALRRARNAGQQQQRRASATALRPRVHPRRLRARCESGIPVESVVPHTESLAYLTLGCGSHLRDTVREEEPHSRPEVRRPPARCARRGPR